MTDRDSEELLSLAADPVAGQPHPSPPAPNDLSDDPESRSVIQNAVSHAPATSSRRAMSSTVLKKWQDTRTPPTPDV